LLAQARPFKLCISANSCQNFSDDFPDTKGKGKPKNTSKYISWSELLRRTTLRASMDVAGR